MAAATLLLGSALTLVHCGEDAESHAPQGAGAAAGSGGVGASVGGAGAVGGSAGSQPETGGGGAAGAPTIETVTVPAGGVSARLAYAQAYDNVAGGDWYRSDDNESATLAWGESYVMMSLAAMFRATGDPDYLDRLAWHADGVLAQRDDHRGVTDYRGVSGPCWRNLSYQPNGEPYCYVVHSGMIGYPLAEFARLVGASGLGQERAYDGTSFGDKAAGYATAAAETVAYHDVEWSDAGYYFFPLDATFLADPGRDVPLNQSNAMGRLLFALYDVTGELGYLDKATKLAQRFHAQLSTGPAGELLWNYWGGPYASPGEDVSHAAINVDFAILAADHGAVFGAADLDGFAQTFVGRVYLDDRTIANTVGGVGSNDAGYRPQVGRWLRLARTRTTVYTAVRDLYELDYPPDGIGSGSLLLGWAYLAEFEPIHRSHFFYFVDWADPNPSQEGDFRQATAYGANVLTTPRDLAEPAVVPLELDVPRATEAQQYDGGQYHAVARWQPTSGPTTRLLAYEPRWPFPYWNDGVLYQFADAFVAGDGILVRESLPAELPAISSSPPTQGLAGSPLGYTATGTGDGPLWWALVQFPVGARIDHLTGAVDWTPPGPGSYPFTIWLQSDWGLAEQSFAVEVP